MNKLLTTIILAIFSIGATAQEKEIWACQQEKGMILVKEEGSWEIGQFVPTNLLLTLNGVDSSFKEGGVDKSLHCSVTVYPNRLDCGNQNGTILVTIDTETGRMGKSNMDGVHNDKYGVITQIFNCTKF